MGTACRYAGVLPSIQSDTATPAVAVARKPWVQPDISGSAAASAEAVKRMNDINEWFMNLYGFCIDIAITLDFLLLSSSSYHCILCPATMKFVFPLTSIVSTRRNIHLGEAR